MSTATVANAVFSERAQTLAADRAASAPTQLDLLPVVARSVSPHDAKALAELVQEEHQRRKAGRPKGAENISSRQLKAMIDQVIGGNPVLWRARWLALEPEEMALRLGITRQEAWDRQDRIAAEFSRFYISPLAPTDDKGNAVPGIAIFTGGAGINTDASGLPPWHRAFRTVDGEIVQVQGVSDAGSNADEQKSYGEKSDGAE